MSQDGESPWDFAENPNSTTRGECGKCGEKYEPYLILFKEGFVNMANRAEIRHKYGYVCPDCLDEEMDRKGYAITDPPESGKVA